METISERLKRLRKLEKWTQKYVADQLGIDRTSYCKYESGKLKLSSDLIIKLAEIFDETTDYILLGKEK